VLGLHSALFGLLARNLEKNLSEDNDRKKSYARIFTFMKLCLFDHSDKEKFSEEAGEIVKHSCAKSIIIIMDYTFPEAKYEPDFVYIFFKPLL